MNESLQKIEPQPPATTTPQSLALGQPLSITDISQRLNFVQQVMKTVMREGTDYGKVPGCGNKPGLFQPGAQKLCLTFQLNTEVLVEKVVDLQNYHREYSLTIRVSHTGGGKYTDGVGVCSTLESKYRFRNGERKCPHCGKPTIITGKAEYGGGFLCYAKKGGCGAKFAENDEAIIGQQVGRVEHDSPADFWNTVRKMAFKRAFVHATINFTNTSELWSQDLEDMNGQAHAEAHDEPPQERDDRDPVYRSGPESFGGMNRENPKREQQAPPRQAKPAAPKSTAPKLPTSATRVWMIEQLLTVFKESELREYAERKGLIPAGEPFTSWTLDKVISSKEQLSVLGREIQTWLNGETVPKEIAAEVVTP